MDHSGSPCVAVVWRDAPDEEVDIDLRDLAAQIEVDCNTRVEQKGAPTQGIKSDGTTFALALQAVGPLTGFLTTLLATLAYFQSRRPKYTFKVTRGDVTVELSNITDQDAKNRALQLSQTSGGDIQVTLVRR